MIALAFIAGIFVAATIAILLVRGANAPQTPKAELLGVSSPYSDAPLYDVDRMRSLSMRTPSAESPHRDDPYSLDNRRLHCLFHCGKTSAIDGETQAICARTPAGKPCGMLVVSESPVMTEWDVAQTAEPETRVRYEFLNQTGMEES
jgi:hypothetical protein